jgi:hypothetical protein
MCVDVLLELQYIWVSQFPFCQPPSVFYDYLKETIIPMDEVAYVK